MKTLIRTTSVLFLLLLLNFAFAQNIGVGEHHPGSKLSVKGGLAIGSSYSTSVAPKEGMIVEGSIGVGTTAPDTNALIDFSSTKKGVLLPRMSSAQRKSIQNPANGLLVFDEDSSVFYYYNAKDASWTNMGKTSGENRERQAQNSAIPAGSPFVFSRTPFNVCANTNYNDLDIGTATHIKFVQTSGVGDFSISGIGAGKDGQMIILGNDSHNNGNLVIEGMSPQSAKMNRISTPVIQGSEKASVKTVSAGNSITLMYDGDAQNWTIINWQR